MPQTRREQARATQSHIVDVALRLFAQQGYGSTSTRQIAQEAGVSEGLIFHHFPTKLDLLRSIPEHRQTFVREVEQLLADSAHRPAPEFLASIAERFVTLVSDERDVVNVMLSESASHAEIYEYLQETLDGTADAVGRYLESRIEAGELRADIAPASAARALLGALLFFLLSNRRLPDVELQSRSRQYSTEVLDLWLRGALSP